MSEPWYLDEQAAINGRALLARAEAEHILDTLQTCQELLEMDYGGSPCDADCECILHDLAALLGEYQG